VAVGVQTDATGTSSFAGGAFAQASGAGSVAIGGAGFGSPGGTAGANASGTDAIAIGATSSAAFANSTAIGFGATTTRANQMSFGTGTNTYTMAGISSAASAAAQTGPTNFVTADASGNLAVSPLSPTLLSNRLDFLDSRITQVRNEERGGVALAIASGQIRYDDRPGKLSVGGGMGEFLGEGGGALGIGFTTPNGRVRLNAVGAGSTHGDFGAGGGISFTLN
jgi:autotransporter adhesin